ncbi:MAG: SGNH/GDSL hydrolase family protein [Bacteroidales bacterium]
MAGLVQMKKSMSIILIILAIGLSNLITAYFIAKFFYKKEMLIRLHPIFDDYYLKPSNKKFWLIGDSRVARWQLNDSCISTKEYQNLGIEGQTSTQVLERTKNYFKICHPKYIIIQVGINDLKCIAIFPDKEEAIKRNTILNIKNLLDDCIIRNTTPIFTTILPTGKVELYRIPFWSEKVEKSIIEVNKSIIEYCVSNNIDYIDLNKTIYRPTNNLKNSLFSDCLHLNSAGYKLITLELTKFLSNKKYN